MFCRRFVHVEGLGDEFGSFPKASARTWDRFTPSCVFNVSALADLATSACGHVNPPSIRIFGYCPSEPECARSVRDVLLRFRVEEGCCSPCVPYALPAVGSLHPRPGYFSEIPPCTPLPGPAFGGPLGQISRPRAGPCLQRVYECSRCPLGGPEAPSKAPTCLKSLAKGTQTSPRHPQGPQGGPEQARTIAKNYCFLYYCFISQRKSYKGPKRFPNCPMTASTAIRQPQDGSR